MQLDYQQRMAVEAKSKAAMVLAGAGSGKTLVLVERIRHLIENERVSPHEIMAFTFTRKAAGEIKNRLRETIGEDAEKVTMGTMHSIALGMIHRFGYELGLRHDITTVYSQWESDYLLREVAIELGYYHKKKWKVPKKQIDEMFARYYQEGIAPARDDQGYPLFSAFIARCKENNALTYGTLLIGLFYLITTMSINMNFSHILVDEVQDIGTLQWNIIDLLCSCFQASLFVVGDIDQCQPGDTKILTSERKWKPIKDLDHKKDRLVTFDRHGCHVYGIKSQMNHDGYYSFRKSKRIFNGNMHSITAGGIESKCTPNHKWPVRYIRNEKNKKIYGVYIMQQNNRFRIGQCLIFGRRTAGFGFSVRCRIEKADKAWILSIHEKLDDALIKEATLSCRYGIPQVCFEEHNPGYKKNIIEGIYSAMNLDLLHGNAIMCLEEHGRNIMFPFWEKRTWTKNGWRTSHECYSCNLIPEICTVPKIIDRSHKWVPIEKNSWEYVKNEVVYSLDVDKYHTYIVNGGLATCNSIYEWRGAVPDRLVNKQHLFDVYKLETNYRSVPEIVEKANNLIQHNNNRITKTMVAHRKQSILGVAVCYNMDSNAIADNLKSRDISNTAILARNHILLKKLSQVMTEKGIDHAYIGSKAELTNSEEFRRFHAFLKLIVNPYDNFSFLLIRDLVGLSREEYAKIRMTAAQCGKSHFQVWNTSQSEWPLFNNEYELDDIVTYLQDSIELKDICQIAEFIADSPGADTKDYLDWLATYDLQDELEETSGQLQLMAMTVHAAKGLEWDTVIIAGCNEGLIPSKQAVTAGGDAIEAERRLMYVAMTRAADTLVMMVRPELTVDARGKEYSNPISRFIEEAL